MLPAHSQNGCATGTQPLEAAVFPPCVKAGGHAGKLMSKTLVEMVAEIVANQASARAMSIEEVNEAIDSYTKALLKIGGGGSKSMVAPEMLTDPMLSIGQNSIICLECGEELKMLTANHLANHSLTSKTYRLKYQLPKQQPLCAKKVSKYRTESAQKRGLPDGLKDYQDNRKKKEKPQTP
jgi:predicted transcriptional regulator